MCRIPMIVDWIHGSLIETKKAGISRPYARTIWRALEEVEEFEPALEDLTEDNLREHLARHEELWVHGWSEA